MSRSDTTSGVTQPAHSLVRGKSSRSRTSTLRPAFTRRAAHDEPAGLSVLDVENLRLHYARTLRGWLDNYEANLEQVREMFDGAFVRAWRLYLSGSIAAFTTGTLQLFQLVFARGGRNAIPWTRAHQYLDTG